MVYLWSAEIMRAPTLSRGVDLGQDIRYGGHCWPCADDSAGLSPRRHCGCRLPKNGHVPLP